MTLSFDQSAPRGLDAMLIVYSLLDDHPASTACESFIRDHTNWFTTALTLFEAKAILTKGLPRILRRIHLWLHQNHQQVAEDFWSQTGGGSHLP
ncbi:hypothetical protein F4X90_00500 [Candidatus Poribacteria bacterium]|nr:hypothetical protein [Candidatus Poribacteria bacterium]